MRQDTPDEVSGIHELPHFPVLPRSPESEPGTFPPLDTPVFPLLRRKPELRALDEAFREAERGAEAGPPEGRVFVTRFVALVVMAAVLGLLACEAAVQHARSWQDVRGLIHGVRQAP